MVGSFDRKWHGTTRLQGVRASERERVSERARERDIEIDRERESERETGGEKTIEREKRGGGRGDSG